MMALYIPIQPSSKTPRMALRVRNSAARRRASAVALAGTFARANGRTCEVAWRTRPVRSHWRRPRRKKSSSKRSLQSVEYRTPALVSEPLRFSIPTSPGQVPLQFATVRMGPRWLTSPASTWCEYCQTASATMSGAVGSRRANTSIPSFCEAMKPWRRLGS